jgi:hypothetical protein
MPHASDLNLTFEHPLAAVRRKAKLERLIAASDALAASRGLDPHRDAARVLDELTGVDFVEIVRRSGVKTPSSLTVESFLGLLKGRITRAALASPRKRSSSWPRGS